MRSSAWAGESVAGSSRGYRNGYYHRDLVTPSGRLEDLNVPRDREGQFHTQVFDRYSRYEPQIAAGLTEMFVAGASTHKVGDVAEILMGVAPSASTVSRLNRDVEQQFTAWRERRLQARLPHPVSGWHPFQCAARRAGRRDGDPDGPGRGHGREQRGAGV